MPKWFYELEFSGFQQWEWCPGSCHLKEGHKNCLTKIAHDQPLLIQGVEIQDLTVVDCSLLNSYRWKNNIRQLETHK
jgi:hypothetical protein